MSSLSLLQLQFQEQLCGPWISNNNVLSTHTKAIYGRINDTFTANVYIDKLQSNYMIAHVKLGQLQLAIQSQVLVQDYCMYRPH